MPFGLTNAVPTFQSVMNEFIDRYKLKGVNAYLDNITVGGMDQASHDENLNALKQCFPNVFSQIQSGAPLIFNLIPSAPSLLF